MTIWAALVVPLALLGVSAWRTLWRAPNLADEGYLVYGTQEVRRGLVPIRDFRAYDPLRYYLCAPFVGLGGHAYVGVRLAMVTVSALSLAMICAMLSVATGSALVAALAASLGLIWMRPLFKQLDVATGIASCGVLWALLAGVAPPVLLGAFAGLAALVGLNIAAYFVGAAVLATMLGLAAGMLTLGAVVSFWLGTLGAGVGLALGALCIPGFAHAYLQTKVLRIMRRGSTNLPLPKPWIWQEEVRQFQRFGAWRSKGFRALFTALPFVYLAALGAGLWAREPFLLASACVGLMTFHHVYSRADLGHLMQVMQPMVLVCAASATLFLGPWPTVVVLLAFMAFSIGLLAQEPEFVLGPLNRQSKLEWTSFGGSDFLLWPSSAAHLKELEAIVDANSEPGDALFAVPAQPGLLALFGRRSAVYDTFPVYPATPQVQAEMLAAFKASAPTVAIIANTAVDGREDLRFEQNYPDVTAFIRAHYKVARSGAQDTVYVREGAAR